MPQIVLFIDDGNYVVGSSLVFRCQLILLSENIDIDTIATFQMMSDDVVLFNESLYQVLRMKQKSFTPLVFSLTTSNYQMQETIHVQV